MKNDSTSTRTNCQLGHFRFNLYRDWEPAHVNRQKKKNQSRNGYMLFLDQTCFHSANAHYLFSYFNAVTCNQRSCNRIPTTRKSRLLRAASGKSVETLAKKFQICEFSGVRGSFCKHQKLPHLRDAQQFITNLERNIRCYSLRLMSGTAFD